MTHSLIPALAIHTDVIFGKTETSVLKQAKKLKKFGWAWDGTFQVYCPPEQDPIYAAVVTSMTAVAAVKGSPRIFLEKSE